MLNLPDQSEFHGQQNLTYLLSAKAGSPQDLEEPTSITINKELDNK